MANDNIKEVGVKFVAEGATEYVRSLTDIKSSMDLTSAEYRKSVAEMDKSADSTEKLTLKSKLYQDQIDTQKEKVSALASQLTLLTEAEEKDEQAITKKTTELTKAETQLIQYETALKGVTEELKNSESWTAKASETLKEMGEKLEDAGNKMMPVTDVVVDIGKKSVTSAADFDKSMSMVGAITGATGDEFDYLRDKALDMATKTTFSANEIAQAYKYMAVAGQGPEKMLYSLDGIVNIAQGSNLNLARASEIVADSLEAYGLSADDLGYSVNSMGREISATEHFVNVLGAATNVANVEVDQMGETFKYFGPVASAMQYSIEDTSVAIGLMANQGIKGSQAGTTLRGAISSLVNPSDQAAAMMDELNISLYKNEAEIVKAADSAINYESRLQDLSKSLESGKISQTEYKNEVKLLAEERKSSIENTRAEIGVQRDLGEMIDNIREGFSGLSPIQQTYAANVIFGRTAMSGMVAIARSTDEQLQDVRDTIYGANDAFDGMGVAAGMAERATANAADQAQIMENAVDVLSITFGDLMMPTVMSVIGVVQDLIEWLIGLDEGTKTIILIITLVVAAIGPLLITLGKVFTGVGALIEYGPKIMTMFSSIGGAFKSFTSLIAAHPIVAAITVVIGIIVLLWTKCEWFRDLVYGLWDWIKTTFQSLVDWIKGAFDAIKNALSALCEGIKVLVDRIIDIFKAWIEYCKSVFVGAWTTVTESIKGVFSSLVDSFKAIWENIKGIFNGIIDFIKAVFTGNWKAAWEAIRDVFGNVFGALSNLVKAPINAVISLINGAIAGINKISITVPDWIPGLGGKNFGFNIPTLPLLAQGGQLLNGMAIVAEAGPELIQQVGGRTIVTPLGPGSKNSGLDNVSLSSETIMELANAIVAGLQSIQRPELKVDINGRRIVEILLDDLLFLLGKNQTDLLTARGG